MEVNNTTLGSKLIDNFGQRSQKNLEDLTIAGTSHEQQNEKTTHKECVQSYQNRSRWRCHC